MSYEQRINRIQRSLSHSLTILGAERKLFFFAMCLGAATFNLLNSLSGGVLMFFLLYFAARWATKTNINDENPHYLTASRRLLAEFQGENPSGLPLTSWRTK